MKKRQYLHDPVLIAWQAQLAEAAKSPWQASLLLQRSQQISERFTYWAQKLRELPRRIRRRVQKKTAVTLAGAALILALSQPPTAQAAAITVTPGAAGISNGDGCSLVEAIINANDDAATHPECAAGSGPDLITLAGNTYSYTTPFGTGSALPDITSEITIEASGATIQRTGGVNFRILQVDSSTFTLNNATISGGVTADRGGGIHANDSIVTINNSTISDNMANGSGGGISASGGELIVDNSIISGNITNWAGGGIATSISSVLINQSSIKNNNALLSGGGISASTAYPAIIRATTISDNTASGNGGGLNIGQSDFTIDNTTISDNEAGDSGGGMFMGLIVSSATIKSSTISGNTAVNNGGGIFADYGYPTLKQSLISGNSANAGDEIYDTMNNITSNNTLFGHNGASNGDAFLGFTPSGSDITATSDGTNPTVLANILSATLANNGGMTQTLALVDGSPAIDHIPAANCVVAADQRGVVRPQGSACDIGAVEKVELVMTIAPIAPADIRLNWTETAVSCQYDVYENTAPYFVPPTATSYLGVASPFNIPLQLGDPAINHFFITQVTCGDDVTNSNEVGEFDFAIEPGS